MAKYLESGWIWSFCLLIGLGQTVTVNGETFWVSTGMPSGRGSLAWAVEKSQESIGADTIRFDIPMDDTSFNGRVWTIYLNEPLAEIVDDSTLVDGFSQTKNQGNLNPSGPEIAISGRNCEHTSGWVVRSAYNQIAGLAIGEFGESGILIIDESAHHNVIVGCYVGIDAQGAERFRNGHCGIEFRRNSWGNTVGGFLAEECNILSGNGCYGLRMEISNNNVVINNLIGTDVTGMMAVPNGDYFRQQNSAGVLLAGGAHHNVIGDTTGLGGNLISGNNRTGIRIEWSGADSNRVLGNFIGIDAEGNRALPNGEAGLVVGRGAHGNQIGGAEKHAGNVISGNYSSGVQFARAGSGNVLIGNRIGTNSSGTQAIGNAHNGIYFYGSTKEGYPVGNVVGPGNLICGNGTEPFSQHFPWAAIAFDSSGTAENWVWGNYIGQDGTGELIAGQPIGILLRNGANNNQIGPDNRIAHSELDGIQVRHPQTLGNRLTRNLFFANGNQAINNVDGGNAELDPPQIESIDPQGIRGIAAPDAKVEIYTGDAGDACVFLGATKCDSAGWFEIRIAVPDSPLALLAIDVSGNTSELSVLLPTKVEPKTLHFTQGVQPDIRILLSPNPFNQRLRIEVAASASAAHLDVVNGLGQFVRRCFPVQTQPGSTVFFWDGCDQRGASLPSAPYFLRIQFLDRVAFGRCLLSR
ncbi:hypothetical protein JW992_16655 [candidate division KSB1 bacterium]|nr:hypothetical protein [candidate division KSB1 bacterium]